MTSMDEDIKQSNDQELFVRADEVDAGTSIPSSGTQKPLSALSPAESSLPGATRPKPPPRPILRREGSATIPLPPPPSQPPPAPPSQYDSINDSLSLPQLKQLVSQFPKTEQRAYAYQYRDAEDFAVEIDEWFHYTELEQDREYLLASREAFEQRWKSFCQSEFEQEDASWVELDPEHRLKFIQGQIPDLEMHDANGRQEALASLYYILAGAWSITAGIDTDESSDHDKYSEAQMHWMHKGVDLVVRSGALEPLYRTLQLALKKPMEDIKATENGEEIYESAFNDLQYREVSFCFSCIYILLESARTRAEEPMGQMIRSSLLALKPNFLVFLVSIISRLRWDDSYNIPLMHALQLLWKSILLAFGDLEEHLHAVKNILQPRVDPFSSESAKPILTASPLDYHLFRQEITSKYPSYNPPLPLIPLELDQKSMLPPLPHHAARSDGPELPSQNRAIGGSILHQPVHIATPAPSPPPSPAGPGGKGAKKQNYQTNQNFPFLYPPLDSGSNNIGGKGSTEFQDAMVGRKWNGSDIPASIIEAGELFASRMRMTRAMRQLWKERDLFMQYDRGWSGGKGTSIAAEAESAQESAHEEDKLYNPDLQSRLEAVEEFFHHALPDLQSLVIVMMKVMLTNVQDIAVRNGQLQESQSSGGLGRSKSSSNLNSGPNSALPMPPTPPRPQEMLLEDLDNIRSHEISQKAISASILLLLKWFKVSHVLKFEYMTQLLLDSNYIQLTLKYFAHQNLEDLVAFKYDKDDLSFWYYCHLHSDHPPLPPTSPDHDSENNDSDGDAAPPPIQRHRRSPTSNSDGLSNQNQHGTGDNETQTNFVHPTVDELGNPLTSLPSTPITEYSSRQFQVSISLLRILQKVTRAKSHRILLLLQFKSSQILRRILRVPDSMLRLYVLKLVKSQVPYCGRKWRQSNMRVITAIYLHCRPELRDEWLAGMHDSNVEGEVDEAVPLEWGLRGLTFWWQKRMYPDVMKVKSARDHKLGKKQADDTDSTGGQEIEDEERDFFQKELDAMGWGLAAMGLGEGEEVGFGEEAADSAAPTGMNGVNGQNQGSNQGWDNTNTNNNNIGLDGNAESWQ